MEKKVKRKFNFTKFLMSILFICILYFVISYLLNIKTKNIVILNNEYYTDDNIIESANIEDYPKFILLNRSSVVKKIKTLDLIDNVKVSKKLGFILKIDVKEKKVLYLTRSTNKYKLSDNTNYDSSIKYNVPLLINYIPEDVEKEFVSEFSNIDKNIISLISEIEYAKNDYDSKRFKLYMNDGNLVYINTNKMYLLNKYMKVVTTLDSKKGILYLDSGNYFVKKEK